MSEDKKSLVESMKDLSEVFVKIEKDFSEEKSKFWSNLSEHEQLLAFCTVVEKLVQGELQDGESYRGVLYDTFGFDMDSYVLAQMSGFIELHNAIYTRSEKVQLIQGVLRQYNIEDTEENIKAKVDLI
jgi:hypothetical protein